MSISYFFLKTLDDINEFNEIFQIFFEVFITQSDFIINTSMTIYQYLVHLITVGT